MSSAQVGAVLQYIRKLGTTLKDQELPDSELLERFALHRDEAAFAVLLKRHGPMVLSVCRSVLHDVHDAEDAFQAAFLLLSQKAGAIHRREAVSGWLYRVAYHVAVRAKANAARRRDVEKRAVTMPSADPVIDMSLRELRAVLFEELEGLPEQYRAPLVLCGLEEKSVEEAARLLGWTKGAVKGRLQRGREMLRVRLRRRGLELPAVLSATALALNSVSGQVSATLADTTLRAAIKVAAGQGVVAGVVSANVAALVQGASKTMFIAKAKIVTALLLAGSIAATAVGVVRHQVSAADQPAAQQNKAEKKTQGDQPLPGAQPKLEAEATVEVRGRVLDPDGRPMVGAKLYQRKSTDGPALSEQATSGPDGRFRFVASKPELDRDSAIGSPTHVMAVAEGYGCDWVKIGHEVAELTLRLVKDVPINGRILDPDGRPVAGAKITVAYVFTVKDDDLAAFVAPTRMDSGDPYAAKRWTGPLAGRPTAVTTGTDGRFRLTGVGRERVVQLRVEGPAIVSTNVGPVMTRATETIVRPGRTPIYGASFDYVGVASRPIRGVVRDQATGKPLAGVSVGNAHGPNWPKPTLTDSEGRYELLGLPKSPHYWLLAKPADGLNFQRGVELQETPGLGVLTCDIELVNGLMVRGRLTDKATGKPIARARVDYHPLGGNPNVNKLPGVWEPRAETTTGPDGAYALTVLPGPGAIGVVGPMPDAYMPACVTVQERKAFFKAPLVGSHDEEEVTTAVGGNAFSGILQIQYNAIVLLEPSEKEETLVKDIALERPRERKGRVLGPDGEPLTGVIATGLAPYGLVVHPVQRLKEAEFTVWGINPRAKRSLVFYHKDKNLGCFVKELGGDSSDPLTVRLQPCGSASGRIVDSDGQPVAGLRLSVQGGRIRFAGEQGGVYYEVTTDNDGRFQVEGLVPGQEYRVSEAYSSTGWRRIHAPAVVQPGKHLDMGDLKMTERDK